MVTRPPSEVTGFLFKGSLDAWLEEKHHMLYDLIAV